MSSKPEHEPAKARELTIVQALAENRGADSGQTFCQSIMARPTDPP